jgi:hypothetical protein
MPCGTPYPIPSSSIYCYWCLGFIILKTINTVFQDLGVFSFLGEENIFSSVWQKELIAITGWSRSSSGKVVLLEKYTMNKSNTSVVLSVIYH